MRRAAAVLSLILLSGIAGADQYRSRVRELPNGAATTSTVSDPQQLLQQTTDPYARAMLLRELAGRAANAKDYATAAKWLREAVGLNALAGPAQDEMRRQLGLLTAQQSGGGLAGLEAQLKADPKPGPDLLAALGGAYVEARRYAEAIPLLQRALAAVPNAEATWRRALAAAYLGAGREREAAPLLEHLLKENPSTAEDWRRYAAVLQRGGDAERTLAVLEIANRVGALGTEERVRYIALAAQQGLPFRAASALQAWISSGELPQSVENYRQLAALWTQARERPLALAALQAVRTRAPSTELDLQIAQLQLDSGDQAGAIASLERVTALGKPSGQVWLMLAGAYAAMGDRDRALRAYQSAADTPSLKKYAEPWIAALAASQTLKPAPHAPAPRASAVEQSFAAAAIKLSAADGQAPPPPKIIASAGGDEARGPAKDLTPVGAERPGNADGTIPAWTGGIARGAWPAGYQSGGRLADPYADEKPLFTITAADVAKYRARLSPGHLALFAKYPDYTMPVFPTHRSVGYPQAILDASKANLGKARVTGSDTLSDARLGFPFPQPQSGVEAMWNHRLRYRGDAIDAQTTQAVVAPGGVERMMKQTERVWYRYGNVRDPVDIAKDNILLYYLTWFSKIGGGMDFLVLVHESANSISRPRNIWVLPPQLKTRMFRIPPVGYDQPFPDSGGLQFIDMIDMYNGAFDRYVWKLTGKRELYIPYNSYRISDGRYKYAQLLTPNHFNQSATRYELHRCWVIEATERSGSRHAFGKRTFYLDEDSWNVVLVENEDREGRLWRFQEGHMLPDYDRQSATSAPALVYDLKDGRYFVNRLSAEDPPPKFPVSYTPTDFSPDGVQARYAH